MTRNLKGVGVEPGILDFQLRALTRPKKLKTRIFAGDAAL